MSEVGFRFAAVQVGYWLGWASLAVVAAGLAVGDGSTHLWLLVGVTLAAAGGNTLAMMVPWRDWLASRRGQLLLDAWCGGLIAFVALLVATAGSSFALLLFLVVPFIAVVQAGWRRGFWLAVTAATCAVLTVLVPLGAGATTIRLLLVGVAAAVALALARTIRLERVHATEASHRIKNDLQTAVDLLLLGRPAGADGESFDETAARLRSIALVHRLLTETHDRVDGADLLRSIASTVPVAVHVEADPVELDAATAQTLGLVANELVTNAVRHGEPPIAMHLTADGETRLLVEDAGGEIETRSGAGLGLSLVRQLVEHGLRGRFELRVTASTTRAEVVFPTR